MRYILLIICFILTLSVLGQTVPMVQDLQIITLPDGTKVVLKADHTWEPITSTPKPVGMSSMLGVVPDDPSNVFATMMGLERQLKKDEFETEQQYIDRIYKLAGDTPIALSKHKLSDTLFFFQNLANYDAERQEFRFDMSKVWADSMKSMRPGRQTYTVEFVERKYGRWVSDILGPRVANVGMPAAEAQKTKPSLTVAVFGVPVGYEWVGTRSTVKVVPIKVLVFNIVTGEVYNDRPSPATTPRPLATPPKTDRPILVQ